MTKKTKKRERWTVYEMREGFDRQAPADQADLRAFLTRLGAHVQDLPVCWAVPEIVDGVARIGTTVWQSMHSRGDLPHGALPESALRVRRVDCCHVHVEVVREWAPERADFVWEGVALLGVSHR